ncbi:E3 ubiquitin-protein ligase RNF13-like [Carica papaya]|uniref:E3 ubiquitin-protein ligase RNF13-like n=1 Tax=Carica papaya TaxID=3649 RepID=UPI000B8CBF0F|nr:E3 ubiquitin-protein ligase RNF13-like [Carica papaya]
MSLCPFLHLFFLLILSGCIFWFFKFISSSNMWNRIKLMISHLKWAFDFLVEYCLIPNYMHKLPEMRGETRFITCGYRCKVEEEEEAECAVCLCKVEEGEEIADLKCDHVFHGVCFRAWISSGLRKPTCLLCRDSIAQPSAGPDATMEVLEFNFCYFGSDDRDRWWLR